ncbi:hypothetical protein DSO57_1024098 [Entomophthora muscae]|uniref:Uncharacterized protein n=1 Tax=Entomophthora muscae TaxID=34485 RepID=A0ACC2SFL4_9FUNG|nr:hypothetical protein DSO57_1024098 [Entomophthora muscae]
MQGAQGGAHGGPVIYWTAWSILMPMGEEGIALDHGCGPSQAQILILGIYCSNMPGSRQTPAPCALVASPSQYIGWGRGKKAAPYPYHLPL